MKNREAPQRIQDQLSIQQIGTETLVYDERRHRAFCLNQSSAVIWNLADGEHTVPQISTEASVQLKVPVSEDFVLFALEELSRDGLIEPSSASVGMPAISRRAMLQRLGVGGAMLLPVVAAIVAPTAAQAYSGCFDCSTSQTSRSAKRRQAAGTPPN